jgi:hypothetical protein
MNESLVVNTTLRGIRPKDYPVRELKRFRGSAHHQVTYRDRIPAHEPAKMPERVGRIRMEKKDPGKCVSGHDTGGVPADFVNDSGKGDGCGKR